ncbi:hypothetical protein GCM10011585_32360 [Edaphobacter dinghuensis]|uniref:Uncharacterized protein n=1 Tax=Edaphobacter dinghuensis TaxID=1560005 RepID=A0A917M9H0_9BACT|nr:hypothetical protein GCM10011585_32360 [Edaphobacter dinghuensis]
MRDYDLCPLQYLELWSIFHNQRLSGHTMEHLGSTTTAECDHQLHAQPIAGFGNQAKYYRITL